MADNIGDIKNVAETTNDEYMMDEDRDERAKDSQIFEFIETPSYVSVVSTSSSEPLYFIKVEAKGEATEHMKDFYGHQIFRGEIFFKESTCSE